jgi:serine/threonine protein kinase/Leucine-rich repeat (LRR) protein
MNSELEHGDRLLQVFDQAKLQPAGEQRQRFLAEACSGDASLQSDVDELLRVHEAAGSFLKPATAVCPGLETEFARWKPEEPGDRIGHYKLLQQIGQGGFGTVWMAEQTEPVRRRVALKIIKLGMDIKEVVARFEQERQALAMMDHPNIARVFDAGATPTGRPFFVMELVRGVKITDYCDEQELSTDERVKLFIHVCQAVQHAHQKGIIHRDLKPSNILVTINDGEAVPKVIDFGVAKATQGHLSEGTLFTRFEQMIGTPLYMSPEQAEMTSLDIDTRSDIYSLGVLLYELLTGRTPIDTATMAQAGMDEIRRIIREVDPPKPSARLKTLDGNDLTTAAKRRHTDATRLPADLRGDIDWIVMKCLEKDRKRRYDTPNGIAADLQRHLRNEVVVARPPTAAYLLGKLIKRNKLAFAAAAAIAASLAAGMAATVRQLIQTRQAEQRVVATLDELRKTAPAFAEQARTLAAKEHYEEAIQKLNYAIELRPDAAEYYVAKADLLQCQLSPLMLAEAAAVYRDALRVQPGFARAEASAKLCDELLAAKPADNGKLTRESLARLYVAMQQQQRPAAELVPVARLLGEEKKLLLEYWLARWKELPVPAEHPLEKRLTMREDGRLALDLSETKITDLTPLAGAPLATLSLLRCQELTDLSPLRGLNLIGLTGAGTKVADLTPLREMHSLEKLNVDASRVTDLSPLSALRLKSLSFIGCAVSDLRPIRQMQLEELSLRDTRVADLAPLIGMPIKSIDLTAAPVVDFSPLVQLPLEKCYLQRNRIADLSVLRGKPLKELALWACVDARNYSVLQEIKTLELLLLPSEYRTLPPEDYAAIGSLRDHPRLRQLGSEIMNQMGYAATGSKEVFWQDWDREQTFVPSLRASGGKFFLRKLPNGSYAAGVESGQPLRDLSIFKGAPISELTLPWCKFTDLSPLHGLPLRLLDLTGNAVTDLSPLRGMPLEDLNLYQSKVKDLSPLVGLPLKRLILERCASVTDLTVLKDLRELEHLTIPFVAPNLTPLRGLPNLRTLAYNQLPWSAHDPATTTEEFWTEYDANPWLARLANSDLKPEGLMQQEDGTWEVHFKDVPISDVEILRGARISSLHLGNTQVSNLEPLHGMPLKSLKIFYTKVSDLRPLAGTALEILHIGGTKVADISVVRGMPLTNLWLHGCTELTDLSPLREMKTLNTLTLPPNAKDFEFLRALPNLRRLTFTETNSTDPSQTAEEFWKDYDARGWLRRLEKAGVKPAAATRLGAGGWNLNFHRVRIESLEMLRGAPITMLDIGITGISDLSPLRGMRLEGLWIYGTKVSDLSPLKGMQLTSIHAAGAPIADISVLRGMPLKEVRFHGCPNLTDLSPLADARELTHLTIPPNAKNFEFLRALPKLERLSYSETTSKGGPPSKTVDEFWKEYDAKK